MKLNTKFTKKKIYDLHKKNLAEKNDNVKRIQVEINSVYEALLQYLE